MLAETLQHRLLIQLFLILLWLEKAGYLRAFQLSLVYLLFEVLADIVNTERRHYYERITQPGLDHVRLSLVATLRQNGHFQIHEMITKITKDCLFR